MRHRRGLKVFNANLGAQEQHVRPRAYFLGSSILSLCSTLSILPILSFLCFFAFFFDIFSLPSIFSPDIFSWPCVFSPWDCARETMVALFTRPKHRPRVSNRIAIRFVMLVSPLLDLTA